MSATSFLLRIGHWLYVNTRFGRWYFNRSLDQVANNYPLGHSAPLTVDYGDFHVRIISYSRDNYGFIIWRDNSNKCIIVDPGYFPPFQDVLSHLELTIDSVLITHKHVDHCGGLDAINELYADVKVFASKRDKVKLANHQIILDEVTFALCEDDWPVMVTAYATPGHTGGHTVFCLPSGPYALVFTGDAIFLGSIGAMFECSTQTNLTSLCGLVKALLKLDVPANKVLLFPGHEYSADSLQFILYNCSPHSNYAKTKLEWCLEQRNWRLPTIPVSLYDELSYSPYLRIAIATKLNQKRISLRISKDTKKPVELFLPTLSELVNEFLLTEKFIKSHLQIEYSRVNEDSMRIKLFEDLFSEEKKILLRCEHCYPKTFANNPHESTLPPFCNTTKTSK